MRGAEIILLLLVLLAAGVFDSSSKRSYYKERCQQEEETNRVYRHAPIHRDLRIVKRYVVGPGLIAIDSTEGYSHSLNLYYSEEWEEQWIRGTISYREYLDLRLGNWFEHSDTTVVREWARMKFN